ncbi:DUF4097 family beta strand repeat-containing protein [Sporosarcina pasteurii]|uniref:Uncharacterized protein n=1 Tax=Sporosarcina pasteurii TaxID=1474 RepID=A0A380CB92_SPOPA|nr:DUF4097 family beta strand repeat-containing protein [Sporosarcina pasteurii]MDS9472679.1 DUF4097 family beta strand repeat-containing protein [Sporosarcina pasteurii]QBQ04339.1 hypothetical protein E2C16_00835 [Sporosarcina pasteurii]SUJ15858.1 Uncharacterised protein [Sporosarcina pasteurii]
MQEKRKRILTMLENGAISMDEALTLLENLSTENQDNNQNQAEKPNQDNNQNQAEKPKQDENKNQASVIDKAKEQETTDQTQELKQSQEPKRSTFEQKDNESEKQKEDQPSADEFLDDLRKDFSTVGDRFMQFMQTAVQKVKDFDLEAPFGKSVIFSHSKTKDAEGIEEILMHIDNGKVTVHKSEEEEIRAEFTVKAYNSETEEAAKKDFLEKVLFVTDDNKLRVSSDMKMMQVNLDLYIPHKRYKKMSVRLMKGSFKIKDIEFNSIRVKTAHGKIEASQLTFEQAEFETANGAIHLTELTGETIDAEALNGRVYIDGELKEVEAQSLNGHVVVTTTSNEAEIVEAKTMSGSVELYIPSTIAISGEVASNIGKLDLQLEDIERTSEQDHLLQRTIRFTKDITDSKKKLHVFGEAKTGSVLVRYNP